jgi:hypothetical protein
MHLQVTYIQVMCACEYECVRVCEREREREREKREEKCAVHARHLNTDKPSACCSRFKYTPFKTNT